MATLIPEYSFEDIVKAYESGRLKELQSGEVIVDGEYIFTFANGNIESSGYQRSLAEYNAQTSNAVGGITLQELLVNPLACPECEKPCGSKAGLQSHMRSHKELVNASL